MTSTSLLDFDTAMGPQAGTTRTYSHLLDQPVHGTILVVDDEAFICQLLRLMLEPNGFRVLQANNGTAAVDLYRDQQHLIDLVLLDVRMPGLSGPDTLVELQKVNPHLRCCFMTGDLGTYTAADLKARGALHVFAKPLFLGELVTHLKGLVDCPH